jgi:membrane protein DedA with SNARE-associated domain
VLNDLHALAAAFDAALAGLAAPWAIALALAITTLLVEDLAIAAGVAVAAQGALSWGASFAAVAAGIAIGDLGLYALGLAATRVVWLRRRVAAGRSAWAREQLLRRLPSAVLLARVIPGLRLVTYTASGFLRVPLAPFCAWVGIAVLLWTAGLYALSAALGHAIAARFGVPVPVAVALPLVAIALVLPAGRAARRRHSARRLARSGAGSVVGSAGAPVVRPASPPPRTSA